MWAYSEEMSHQAFFVIATSVSTLGAVLIIGFALYRGKKQPRA